MVLSRYSLATIKGGVLAEVYPKFADTLTLDNIRPMASKKHLILIYPRLPLCLRSERVMVEWIPKVCLYVREITRLVDRDPTFLVYSLFLFVYFVHVSLEWQSMWHSRIPAADENYHKRRSLTKWKLISSFRHTYGRSSWWRFYLQIRLYLQNPLCFGG